MANGAEDASRGTWRAPRRVASSERDLDATLPARNLLALSYHLPARFLLLITP